MTTTANAAAHEDAVSDIVDGVSDASGDGVAAVDDAASTLATQLLEAASDLCVHATKMESLMADYEAHATANCVPMCTSQRNHEFKDCTQFSASCLKEASTNGFGYGSYGGDDDADDDDDDKSSAEQYFDQYADMFAFVKKCPDFMLGGFMACARDADHDGYGDGKYDGYESDYSCAEMCALVGTYEDDGDDDYDFSAKDVCDAFDEAVKDEKATCEAAGTCAAVNAAVSKAATEQAAADSFASSSTQTVQVAASLVGVVVMAWIV
jgi:hypothetical protein